MQTRVVRLPLLVTGDRHWTDRSRIEDALKSVADFAGVPYPNVLVRHGACRGADLLAKEIALRNGMQEQGYPADWNERGLGAGPARNRVMVKTRPALVLAFHDDLYHSSRGTANCVRQAIEYGLPVRLCVSYDCDPEDVGKMVYGRFLPGPVGWCPLHRYYFTGPICWRKH